MGETGKTDMFGLAAMKNISFSAFHSRVPRFLVTNLIFNAFHFKLIRRKYQKLSGNTYLLREETNTNLRNVKYKMQNIERRKAPLFSESVILYFEFYILHFTFFGISSAKAATIKNRLIAEPVQFVFSIETLYCTTNIFDSR